MDDNEKKFPPKLYAVVYPHGDKADSRVVVTHETLDSINEDGKIVGVYRLTHKKRMVLKKNLSLASV